MPLQSKAKSSVGNGEARDPNLKFSFLAAAPWALWHGRCGLELHRAGSGDLDVRLRTVA